MTLVNLQGDTFTQSSRYTYAYKRFS